MSIPLEIQQLNQAIFDDLATAGREKYATDAINDFTRTRMREDGFYRRIMPPLQISNDELDRQYDTDKPVKVVDKEPDSPAAMSIPFATLPNSLYIRGPKYRVMFARIVSPQFTKDVDELRTWTMDIRQVLSDNSLKDMLAEEDAKFIYSIESALIAPNTPVLWSGRPQWQQIPGGITRDTFMDSLKIMPRTNAHLEVKTCLLNNVTIKELQKWGREEMGGDLSQEILKNGWTQAEFSGIKLVITIKRDLVPDNRFYMFSDEKFIGKSFTLEDTTMFVERKAYMLTFFSYQTLGGSLGHTAGLSICDFT